MVAGFFAVSFGVEGFAAALATAAFSDLPFRHGKADAARNDERLSDFEPGVRRDSVLEGDLIGSHFEFLGDRLDGIEGFHRINDAGGRRNFYGLPDFQRTVRIEIVRPNDGIYADAELFRDKGKVLSGSNLVIDELVDAGNVAFVAQDDARFDESGILGEQRFGRVVLVRRDNRGFVINPYGRSTREPEGREGRIDRKDEDYDSGKDLESPNDSEYSVLLKHVASASMALETGPYVHFEPHSGNLRIKKTPRRTSAKSRVRTWEPIATLP